MPTQHKPTLGCRVPWPVLAASLGCWLLLGVDRGWGDDTRYQLGKRVQRFERRFEGTTDVERARALPFLKEAVSAFFGFDLPRAGRALDRATRALDHTPPGGPDELALLEVAMAVNLSFARRGVTPDKAVWEGELRRGYPIPGDWPSLTLVIRIGDHPLQEWQFDQLPGRFTVDLTGIPPGDHVVQGEVRVGELRWELPAQRVSVIADAESRLQQLESTVGGWPPGQADPTVVATLKESQRLVRRLIDKDDGETDLPGERLLREAEELVTVAANAPGPIRLWRRPGEYWVTLAGGKRTQRARLLVPKGPVRGVADWGSTDAESARPLVVALHGAGGSENMFFDAYGAGKIVRLCEERGWLLLTPGSSPMGGALELPELVSALRVHHPVDEQRVAVVGHSMGAMQGLQLASRNPGALCSLAILGGGRPVRSPQGLREVDLFAAAGAEDFGRGGVRQVIAQWRGAGLPVEERDYPEVEHLGVVQVALDEVFHQFEQSFAR